MRNKYAIVLLEPNPTVAERIREHYPDSYAYTHTFFLVHGGVDDVVSTIASKVGLKSESRAPEASGVVLKLKPGYSGHTKPDLWDWLSIRDSKDTSLIPTHPIP